LNLTPRRVFDLYPPLLRKERGKDFIREASPLFDSSFLSLPHSREEILERGL